MLEARFFKAFKYAFVLIVVGSLFQCANVFRSELSLKVNVSPELSISSPTSKNLLVVLNSRSSNTSSNQNVFFEAEEEFEKNDEISKRNSLPVLTLTNLFRAFYSKEIRTPFSLFHPSSYFVASIPLYVRNCIFLI